MRQVAAEAVKPIHPVILPEPLSFTLPVFLPVVLVVLAVPLHLTFSFSSYSAASLWGQLRCRKLSMVSLPLMLLLGSDWLTELGCEVNVLCWTHPISPQEFCYATQLLECLNRYPLTCWG